MLGDFGFSVCSSFWHSSIINKFSLIGSEFCYAIVLQLNFTKIRVILPIAKLGQVSINQAALKIPRPSLTITNGRRNTSVCEFVCSMVSDGPAAPLTSRERERDGPICPLSSSLSTDPEMFSDSSIGVKHEIGSSQRGRCGLVGAQC